MFEKALLPFVSIRDLVYPRVCACNRCVCDRPSSYLCEACKEQYMPTDYANGLASNALYLEMPLDIPLVAAYAGWHFMEGNVLQTHVHAIKYKRYAPLAFELGVACGQELRGKLPLGTVVVPVPLHPRKFSKRGFNQAEWIARGLAKGAGLGYNRRLAQRTVHTQSQTRLSKVARLANMDSVFQIRGVAPQSILLVDDVITTGATIGSLARAFADAGTRYVSVAALAHASS